MALTLCPECNGTVSDQAKNCPHCGYPIEGGKLDFTESKKESMARIYACLKNVAVRRQVQKLNLFDVGTLSTANMYCSDHNIGEKIYQFCQVGNANLDLRSEYHKMEEYLPIIELDKNVDKSTAIKMLFEQAYNNFMENLNSVRELMNSDFGEMKSFVSYYISADYKLLYEISRESLQIKILKYVQDLINFDNYLFLSEVGFDFEDFNEMFCGERFFERTTNAIADSVERFIAECKANRKALEEIINEYDEDVRMKQNEINRLEGSLNQLGMFSFFIKRKMKKSIENLKIELIAYKREKKFKDKESAFIEKFI